MKVMSTGLQGGASFMEDYTYHFEKGNDLVLGSHMLEVCPSISVEEKPILDVQHLGIGGKDDPARLIFNTQTGPAIVASLIDLGDRYRLLVNCIDTVEDTALPCRNCRWRMRCGKRNRICQLLPKRGSSLVARTIPSSAMH